MYVANTAPALAFDYLLIIVIWPAETLKHFRVVSCFVVDILNILDPLGLLDSLDLLDSLNLLDSLDILDPSDPLDHLDLFSGVFEQFFCLWTFLCFCSL